MGKVEERRRPLWIIEHCLVSLPEVGVGAVASETFYVSEKIRPACSQHALRGQVILQKAIKNVITNCARSHVGASVDRVHLVGGKVRSVGFA